MKYLTLNFILFLAACLTLGSCSGDDAPGPETGKQHTLTMTIGSRDFAPTADNELINSWWMAFVAPDGTVVETIDRSEAFDTKGQRLPSTPVERETFNVTLHDGTYKVYAFANFTGSSPSSNIWGITKGAKMPDLSSSTWATGIGSDSNIPMTGFITITVPAVESQNIMVEVVRMFAKLQFDLRSSSSKAKKVTGIRVLNASTSKVRLLPDYSLLNGLAPSLPADATSTTLDYGNLDIDLNAKDYPLSRYVFESNAAAHPTGHYVLEFDIRKEGSPGTETITSLAYQLDHITRNDYVRIPVTFTDWELRLNVRFYPPIGGYPAVIVDSNGDEFYARFGTSGYFEIIPDLRDSDTGVVLEKNKFSVAATVDSGGEIFSLAPEWKSGEIVGELAESKTGTAVIDLRITVTDDALKQTFTRKLYIIRN